MRPMPYAYDVPEVIRPIYHTASGQMIPRPISGVGADAGACDCGGSAVGTALKLVAAATVVYLFRRPIGMWLAGFDSEGRIKSGVVSGAKRAGAATSRALKRISDQ